MLVKTHRLCATVSILGKTNNWKCSGKGGGAFGGSYGNDMWAELVANMVKLQDLSQTPGHRCPLCLKEFKERSTASTIQNQHMFKTVDPAACDSVMNLKVVEMCNSEIMRISSLMYDDVE